MLDHALANSWQLLELFRFFDQLLDRFRQAIDQFRRLFVAPITPNNRAVDFQELRGIPQNACDLLVVHSARLSVVPQNPALPGGAVRHQ